MSLNKKEIDLILSELHIQNARIQDVYQPTIQTLYIELYIHKNPQKLHIYLMPGHVRMHTSEKKLPKPKKPQRFQQLLQSKIIGMYVASIEHIQENRIVKMHLIKKIHSKTSQNVLYKNKYLYFKLWSNNANIIYTDENNIIIDLLYRSPRQNLMPKKQFILPEVRTTEYTAIVRAWNGESFNKYIEAYYESKNNNAQKKHIAKTASQVLEKRMIYVYDAQRKIAKRLQNASLTDDYIEYGNAILAQAHTITESTSEIFAMIHDTRISITIDTAKSPSENAQYYFTQARKTKKSAEILTAQYQEYQKEYKTVKKLYESLPSPTEDNDQAIEIPQEILNYIKIHAKKQNHPTTKKHVEKSIGITMRKDDFIIFIGRNAIENDTLLRKHSRGEDIWFHVQGEKGGFVFLRCPRISAKPIQKKAIVIKSAPLDLLIECANLAACHSKVKDGTHIDVYYAKVKHLRRVKKTIGQVIPTISKTLQIQTSKSTARAFIAKYS